MRFTLTSEAGLNDGLAFPFVYAAILLATEGAVGGWAWEWLGFYLVAKVVIGVVAGLVVGRVLALRGVPVTQTRRCGSPSAGSPCWPWPRSSRRTASERSSAATASSPCSCAP